MQRARSDNVPTRSIIEELIRFNHMLASSPDDDETTLAVPKLWSLHQNLGGHADIAPIELCLLRQSIMTSHSNIFIWIQALVDQHVLQTSGCTSWLQHLFQWFFNSVLISSTFSVDSSKFLPGLSSPHRTMHAPGPKPSSTNLSHRLDAESQISISKYSISHHHTPDQAQSVAHQLAFDLVWCWLGFSNDPAAYYQVQLVCILREAFGSTSILLLPDVWEAYMNSRAACTRRREVLTPDHFKTLRHDLSQLPFLDHTHSQYEIYQQQLIDVDFHKEAFILQRQAHARS